MFLHGVETTRIRLAAALARGKPLSRTGSTHQYFSISSQRFILSRLIIKGPRPSRVSSWASGVIRAHVGIALSSLAYYVRIDMWPHETRQGRAVNLSFCIRWIISYWIIDRFKYSAREQSIPYSKLGQLCNTIQFKSPISSANHLGKPITELFPINLLYPCAIYDMRSTIYGHNSI